MQVDGKSSQVVLRPGMVVAGKYRVERTLAEGGMGLVVAATHLHLEQRVALKFLRGEVSSHHQWDALARFSREAKAVAQLRSEHVAHVLDAGVTDEGTPYMVMEYLEGRSLAGALQADGPLDVAIAVEYAIQACEGLAEAHAHGIVHRDIKPYNLFLTERSPGRRAIKIVDFGISKFAFSDNVITGVIVGSPCYMSPEQLRSTASVDHRSDIWSLGATLFELLAGRAAFDASQTLPELVTAILDRPTPNLREVRPDVPEKLAAIVARCLSKDREERFQSAGEVAMALLAFAPARAHVPAERAASMKPGFTAPPEDPEATPPEKSSLSEGSLAPVSNELPVDREGLTPVGLATRVAGMNEAEEVEKGGGSLSPPGRSRDAGEELEMEADVLRFRAPKWLGIATLAGAVVLVFCTILVAAPDRGGKQNNTPAPVARAGAAASPLSVAAPALTRTEAPPPPLPAAASLAPLEPAAPELVELVVRASPASAKVTIDGTPVPRNPFRASYPKGGEAHRIAASADGYESKSESVSLTSDVVIELSLNRLAWQPPPVRRVAAVLQPVAPPKPVATQAPMASTGGEVDSAGGRMPLRPIETRDPYGNP
ncbi:MAG TPA: serine/threonine-protein kinase [Polyangiaceae bacterium]|nr:serine/threonine-protein kinase [Polyangiaceae bacterium]